MYRSLPTIVLWSTEDGGHFVGGALEGGSPWEEVPDVKVEEEPFLFEEREWDNLGFSIFVRRRRWAYHLFAPCTPVVVPCTFNYFTLG